MVGDGENSQILSKSKGKKDKLEMTRQVLPSHSTHSLCFHLTLAAWPTPSTVSSRPPPPVSQSSWVHLTCCYSNALYLLTLLLAKASSGQALHLLNWLIPTCLSGLISGQASSRQPSQAPSSAEGLALSPHTVATPPLAFARLPYDPTEVSLQHERAL